MGLRWAAGWLLHGESNTTQTLDALSADLRGLQQRVDELGAAVASLQMQQVTELAAIRNAVTAVTDDLVERVAALQRNAST